jgi:hypothetical protein
MQRDQRAVVDRRGCRLTALVCTGLIALAALALSSADSLPTILGCRAVAGVAEAFAYVGFAAASVPARPDGTDRFAKIH